MTIDRTDPYTRLDPRPIPAEDFAREETYGRTRAPVDLASTLLPEAYTSPEFFAIERERVFAVSWVAVGFTSQRGTDRSHFAPIRSGITSIKRIGVECARVRESGARRRSKPTLQEVRLS